MLCADAVDRFRAISELVADPVLHVYKNASPQAMSPAARSVLTRHCTALLSYMWGTVEGAYGVRRGKPFCAVYQGTRLSMLLLTTDAEKAVSAAAAWYGTKPSIAVVVGDTATVFEVNEKMELVRQSMVTGPAENWVVLPVAIAYSTPPWLTAPLPPAMAAVSQPAEQLGAL